MDLVQNGHVRGQRHTDMGMGQYLLIPFLGGWTSIYQLFWCSPGVQGFDTLPYQLIFPMLWFMEQWGDEVPLRCGKITAVSQQRCRPLRWSKGFCPQLCRILSNWTWNFKRCKGLVECHTLPRWSWVAMQIYLLWFAICWRLLKHVGRAIVTIRLLLFSLPIKIPLKEILAWDDEQTSNFDEFCTSQWWFEKCDPVQALAAAASGYGITINQYRLPFLLAEHEKRWEQYHMLQHRSSISFAWIAHEKGWLVFAFLAVHFVRSHHFRVLNCLSLLFVQVYFMFVQCLFTVYFSSVSMMEVS